MAFSDGDGIRVKMDEASVQKLMAAYDGPAYRAIERACIQVQTWASRFCPVDTGRLRASISYGVSEDGKGLVGYVGSNVEYARYVELGTSRMAAKPFLRPAIDAVKGGA